MPRYYLESDIQAKPVKVRAVFAQRTKGWTYGWVSRMEYFWNAKDKNGIMRRFDVAIWDLSGVGDSDPRTEKETTISVGIGVFAASLANSDLAALASETNALGAHEALGRIKSQAAPTLQDLCAVAGTSSDTAGQYQADTAFSCLPFILSALLKAGVDVNGAVSGWGATNPLSNAAQYNRDPSVITLLLKAGANPDSTVAIDGPPLIIALKKGNASAASVLLQSGCTVGARDAQGLSALSYADPAMVEMLLSHGANPNETDANGMTILMYAARTAFPETVSLLLKAGADRTAVSSGKSMWDTGSGGKSAYDFGKDNARLKGTKTLQDLYVAGKVNMLALAANGSPEDIQANVQAGAKLDVRDAAGMTPLMIAATKNPDPAVIGVLVAAGAKLNETDLTMALTPLMHAINAKAGPSIVLALLKAGADLEVLNRVGQSALMLAAQQGASLEIVSALLSAGAKVSTIDSMYQQPALMFALGSKANPAIVSALLKAGSDLTVKNRLGQTPLIWAVQQGASKEIISMLLAAGAKVNDQDMTGQTALMLAAQPGKDSQIITLLLKAGADANLKSLDGKTALDVAKKNKAVQTTAQYAELEKATSQ